MWGFLKNLGRAGVAVASAAVEPGSMINLAVMAGAKHGIKALPNSSIPYINWGLSTGISYVRNLVATGDPVAAIAPSIQEGTMLAGGSTFIHQALKIPIKEKTGVSI
jgi:hypothetical protein